MQKLGISLLTLLLLLPLVHAVVPLDGFVTDRADVLTDAQEQELIILLQQPYLEEKAQIAVVIVPSLEGQDITSYALDLAQGTLGDDQKNNGLLILLAIEERQYRFEVGRGLEPIFNDAKIGRMGRQLLVPALQKNNYFQGLYETLQAINAELHVQGAVPPQTYIQEETYTLETIQTLFGFIFMIIMISIIARSIKKKGRNDEDVFLTALFAASLLRPPRGGFGGGGFGRGGFGGFGGGGFGGGGAGGGW